jgi:hypothetical protein
MVQSWVAAQRQAGAEATADADYNALLDAQERRKADLEAHYLGAQAEDVLSGTQIDQIDSAIELVRQGATPNDIAALARLWDFPELPQFVSSVTAPAVGGGGNVLGFAQLAELQRANQAAEAFAQRQFVAGLSDTAFQRPLLEAQATGFFGDRPTLEREFGLQELMQREAGMRGYIGGAPTLERTLGLQGLMNQLQIASGRNATEIAIAQAANAQRAAEMEVNRALGTGQLTGFFGGEPTLERELGVGGLNLNRGEFLADLIRNPTNFVASQLLTRGPGATVGDVIFPGAVGDLLFGGDIQERNLGAQVVTPSLQQANLAGPSELAAAGAGFQFLTGIPQEALWGDVQRKGIRGF